MQRIALLVGVDHYDDERINNLGCCSHDAHEAGYTLKHGLGFNEALVLTQGVTADKVDEELRRMGRLLKPGDLFVFFFAGHGKTHAPAGTEPDQLFLLPRADADLLNQQALAGATGILSWRGLKTQTERWAGVRRLFLFDACRLPLETSELSQRGTAASARYQGAGVFRDMAFGRTSRPKPASSGAACAVINSCDDGQQAEELPHYPGGGHGKFSAALIEEWQQAARERRGVRADADFAQRLHQRMQTLGQTHGGAGHSQMPLLVGDVVELVAEPPAPPPAEPAPAPPLPPKAAGLTQWIDDFERQLAAGQLQSPAADCCVGTLALMRAAGLGSSSLGRYERALQRALDASQAPVPPPPPAAAPAPGPSSQPAQAAPTVAASPASHTNGKAASPASRYMAGMAGLGVVGLAVAVAAAGYSLWGKQQEPAPVPPAALPLPAARPAKLPVLDGASAQTMAELQASAAAAAGVAVRFTDAMKSGVPGPPMVVVPAGRYTIGSSDAERARYVSSGVQAGVTQEMADWEKPQQVQVATAFGLGQHEVTRGEFAAFAKATQHQAEGGCGHYDGAWKQDPARNWRSPGFDQTDEHPVVCVSWNEAKAYANWLSAQTGARYRLASEAEWELAARAGTTTQRFWDDDLQNQQACAYANTADIDYGQKLNRSGAADCSDGWVYTAPVGSKQANALGLKDMLGNAAEWVADCFDPSHATVPADGSARTECTDTRRVVRGWAWSITPGQLRSASRDWYAPYYRNDFIGFRLARTF